MAEQTVEEKAKAQGWKPQEEFGGDPKNFVDAETYVKRGEEILPFMKASNRRLNETVEQLQGRLVEQERINRANSLALEEVQTANREVVVERAEQSVEEIEAAIVDAREANDVQTELKLLRQHAAAVGAVAKAKEKPAPRQQQQQLNGGDLTKTPEFQSFMQANPWWTEDPVMRAASIEIQNQLYSGGKITAAMPMAERLTIVADATRAKFGMKDSGRRGNPSRVEGGGGQGGGNESTAAGKSFSDLPEDAKVACDKAGKRLKIGGEGAKYKTIDDWRKSYTATYFSN